MRGSKGSSNDRGTQTSEGLREVVMMEGNTISGGLREVVTICELLKGKLMAKRNTRL